MTKTGAADDHDDRLARAIAERDALARTLAISRDREAFLSSALQHRVRNLLALVRSVFSRTVEVGNTLEHVAAHFPGRLDTLAQYQSRSAASLDPIYDLQAMVCDELMVFAAADDPRITIDGPPVRLASQTAAALGLALHELIANAIKFGALSAPHGSARLAIGWQLVGDRLTFDWRETGVAVVGAAPLNAGFGREYIEQGLAYQIDAETLFELVAGGIHCRIALAIDRHNSLPSNTALKNLIKVKSWRETSKN